MPDDALRTRVLATARAAGLDAVGVAPAAPFLTTRRELVRRRRAGLSAAMQFTYRNPTRSTDPGASVAGARALVVGARGYGRRVPERTPAEPHAVVARYSWRDEYEPLRVALEQVASVLRAEGHAARVLADDNALVDREAAYRAGLGWYGKNANLLLKGRGSWFVLGSVVTDAPLVASPTEPVADGCGSCTRCIGACPTGAIVAPGVVDARRCLAWLVQADGWFPSEHRAALGGRIYGCDDCQEVCPHNRGELDPADPADEAWVPLLDLLSATDAEILDRHGRWYIAKRDARSVRRNALVALGNVGDGQDHRVAAALRDALRSEHPVVRGHAVWAAARLGRTDLLAGMADEPDGAVRDELVAAGVARS